MKEDRRYRKNAAAFVLDGQGRIMVCRRADRFHTWQIPQGGIDESEEPQQAVLRELSEEIGTSDVEILGSLPQVIHYDWPEEVRRDGLVGQEQHVFLVRLKPQAVVCLDACGYPEFDDFAWVTAEEFLARVEGFKAAAYAEALGRLLEIFPGFIALR